jgi:hypothetical protein
MPRSNKKMIAAIPQDLLSNSSSTAVRVRRITRDRIYKYGKFQETFDQVLNRILDDYEGCRSTLVSTTTKKGLKK